MDRPTWRRGRCGLRAVLLLAVVASPAWAGDAESTLRRTLAWQIALERVGFSPGLIDNKVGPKTRLATQEFQRVHGLPKTGELDDATAAKLNIAPDDALGRYTIEAADLAEIGDVPKSWIAKSKLSRLGHDSLRAVLAEKFHCAQHLLDTLNAGKDINAMKAGDKVIVPSLGELSAPQPGAFIEVNLTEKVIRVMNSQKQLIALFHCSVAANKAKLPTHDARVVAVAENPSYTFNPSMWPEVKEHITQKLYIPPGPRNPVGRCWIALSLPGYGMHGTPNPELIGKTGSHGCFRLTNWDALRLAKMVKPDMPVRFTNTPRVTVASR